MLKKESRIGIIGLGLLGGSYAQGLSEAGYQVSGIDINADAVKKALERGWIVKGGEDPSLIQDCDIVISALYPDAFVEWVKKNQDHFKSGCILSDVTGIKRKVMRSLKEVLRKDVEYIAVHPMAGRESKGIDHADASQFAAANYIIVTDNDNTKEAIDTARQIGEALRFAKISVLDSERHDRIIGFVSQLCHVIAISLMNISDDPSLVDYTGDSFRDLTRIADINEDLWPELFIGNKDFLIEEIDSLIEEMESMKELIDAEDVEALKKKMILATVRRRRFNKKKEII